MALASSEDFRVLDAIDELTSLAAEWAALVTRCPGYHLSQTFQWADAAWRIVAQPAGRSLRCLTLRSDARLVAVWPLVVRREGRLDIVQPLGFEGSEYSAPLVEPGAGTPARLERLLQAASCLGDTLLLAHVRSDSALAAVLGTRRQLAAAYDAQPASYIARDDYADWNALAGTFSSKFRYALRRSAKRLAENGRVEIGPSAPADRSALIDWALEQKKAWLTRANMRNDWIWRKDYRDFLVEMTNRDDETGRTLLFAITVDGAPVAANLVTVDRQRAEGYLTVFDTRWSAASPGNVLTEHVLRWAFERGLDLDFRIGDEAYKDRWTTRSVEVVTWCIAASLRGAPGVALLLARQFGAATRRRIGKLVRSKSGRERRRDSGQVRERTVSSTAP
jgi:CelD/BcsL family acetyltransferase involved in cellulose biosynthesis